MALERINMKLATALESTGERITLYEDKWTWELNGLAELVFDAEVSPKTGLPTLRGINWNLLVTLLGDDDE